MYYFIYIMYHKINVLLYKKRISMRMSNKNFSKRPAKRSGAILSLWDKVLELLGLPQLEPVPIKNFEKRQGNYARPNLHGARLWR